ncbi:MAG: hypothetical protein EG825_01625 [Rhodocyclaceae bacterium]|nr:hypothetical protein [Rhodocyclaceae bacterium]
MNAGRYYHVLLLAALAWSTAHADTFVRDDLILDPTPERLSVCHGNTCRLVDFVSLEREQWREIQELFDPPADSAAAERGQIWVAIGRMESFIGPKTGTEHDLGGAEHPFASGDDQMDCIDESTNTSLYITLFQNAGLLRFHQVDDRSTRGYFFRGWPHTTAVMREIETGKLWAVDSWFFDNGVPPAIIPLNEWEAGWKPPHPDQD